jgi:hypothetical protein
VAVTSLLVFTGSAVWWMFTAKGPDDALVDKANVAGALFGAAGLIVSAIMWAVRDRGADALISDDQLDAAADRLARATLAGWDEQAWTRGINAPVPAAVRWTWAADDVAISAGELHGATGDGFTHGAVTALRDQLYRNLPAGRARLVILGAPGSGKTGAMLLLLLDILKERTTDPVPLWLTLGSWNPRIPLLRWASSIMARDYPSQVGAGAAGTYLAWELLRAGKVALFLDGLDEMPRSHRKRALDAIERQTRNLKVVLTSRPVEYRQALGGGRIFDAAVVQTLPLDPGQAEHFLLRDQLGERRSAWADVVKDFQVRPDGVAARTLVTPLALSLARDTYRVSGDPHDLLDEVQFPSTDVLLAYLLQRLLVQAYPDEDERERALRRLRWLAHRMGSRRDLAWWLIPPTGLIRRSPRALARRRKKADRPSPAPVTAGLTDSRLLLAAVLSTFAFAFMAVPLLSLQTLGDLGALRGGPAIVAGLVVGGLAGKGIDHVLRNWTQPLADSPAVTPLEAYRAELSYEARAALICAALGLAVTLSLNWLIGAMSAVACLLTFAYGPAVALWLLQAGLFARGAGWIDFMRLLPEAQDRQVLRQVGPVYQFRHAALQNHLATGDPTVATGR